MKCKTAHKLKLNILKHLILKKLRYPSNINSADLYEIFFKSTNYCKDDGRIISAFIAGIDGCEKQYLANYLKIINKLGRWIGRTTKNVNA